jgi:DNA-binding helix-hairpin-helix protein with protein kinase domain
MIDDLQRLRLEAPAKEAKRKEAWRQEVHRIEQQRVAVAEENQHVREAWLREMEIYRGNREAIERHNVIISKAKGRRESERARRQAVFNSLLDQIDRLRRTWLNESRGIDGEYDAVRSRMIDAKAEYEALRTQFEAERQQLAANRREQQLNDYLGSALIDDAHISGVGPKRKAILAAYGVEAALDVTHDSINAIPRFGPQMVAQLCAWRATVQSAFHFDGQKAISSTVLRSLHMRYHSRRIALQRELQGGEEKLQEIAGRAERRLNDIQREVARLYRAAAQAEVDVVAV